MRMKTLSTSKKYRLLSAKAFLGFFLLTALCVPLQRLSAQTLWYYNGSGALNSTSSWGTNTNGTGGTLSDFTSGGRYFILQNTTAVTLTGTWNIGTTSFASAGGDSLIIGNPSTAAAPITITLASGSALTVNKSGTISVSAPSSGNHKIIYQNATAISFGTISDPNLEIVFDGATITTVSVKSFGDLSLINGANVNMGGANTKFRNISIDATSTLSGPIGASSNFLAVRSGGAVTINGTFRAGKNGGLATTTGTGAFTGTVTTNGNSSTITNASAATAASTVGLTQTVTCASTAGLSVGSYISVASGTGAFPALTYIKAITSSTKFTASASATTALSGATISTTLYALPCISSTSVTAGGAVSKLTGTGTFAGSTTVIGVPNSTTLALSASPTATIISGATVQVAFTPSTTWSTLVFEDAVANLTLGSASTIDFYRGTSGQTAAQTVDTLSYANLILSNSGTASNKSFLAGTINVSGSFTVSNLLGTITQPSSTTINFTGSSAQTLPSQLTTYSVLGISGGTKNTSGNISVTSSLNLTSGTITTVNDTVIVTSAGTVSRSAGWVNGNLRRNISITTGSKIARVFNIGDATNYAPITLTFDSVSTAGSLTASSRTPITSVANYATAPVSNTAYVNRYWNISNTNSTLAFTGNYTAAMTYVNGDIVGGATSATLIAAQNVSGTWSKPSTSGTTNVSTATGLTAIGNFILANDCITVTPSISISATTNIFCTGTSSTFTATPTNGGTAPTYQWKKNGNNISGANSTTLVLTSANVANSDTITCVMTANNICQTSATATSNKIGLTVGALVTPSVTISTSSTDTICNGSVTTFTASSTNGGSAPSFEWFKNGQSQGTGNGTITFGANTLSTGNSSFSCVMTANNTCQTTGTAPSNTIVLYVKQSPLIGVSTVSLSTLCGIGSTTTAYNTNTSGVVFGAAKAQPYQ